ncbi:MAG TPA: hypothetical protein ENK53_09060 [Thiotrichales bacterium]|nr:hypothetical protein [Thiotrichales bacterium]
MSQDRLAERLSAYDTWKRQVLESLEAFQSWLDAHRLEVGEDDLRLYETMEAIRRDRLTLAFVAEFSRGKTELINAIFFADYGRRLLPSEAGRTTMCPSELFYDAEADEAYVRLLPIETRRDDRSIAEFRESPDSWVHMPLDVDDAEQMAQTFREVMRTREVPLEEARALGLYDESQDAEYRKTGRLPERVEIPKWRHALISFPHPLLRHGLVILDTPGLNALGTEPELTLSMLPSAQAVLFILAADTGVTRSDLEMWEHHLHVDSRNGEGGSHRIVALNKIDILWDDLKEEFEINGIIRTQVRKVAEQLNIDADRVFPVSAQKGLVAKVRGDAALLERSRLPDLEEHLSQTVLPNRQQMLREHVLERVGGLQTEIRDMLAGRLAQTEKELESLRSLRGRNADVLHELMRKSREEQAAYMRSVESFQASRRVLQQQARELLAALSLESFDRLIRQTREAMTGAWTTRGLRQAMAAFFESAHEIMNQAADQAEQTRKLIRATYRKFHEEHGLPELTPRGFSVDSYHQALHRLMMEAEAFRNSPVTAMTEQSIVVKRFFVTLVAQARSIFFRANQEAEVWLREVMNPLVAQIKDHKKAMDKHLETLRRISESREVLDERLRELESQREVFREDLAALEAMHARLTSPLPAVETTQTEVAAS